MNGVTQTGRLKPPRAIIYNNSREKKGEKCSQKNQEESHTDLRGENKKREKQKLLLLLLLKRQPKARTKDTSISLRSTV